MPNRARVLSALSKLQSQLADNSLANAASYRAIRQQFDTALTNAVESYLGGGNRRANVNAAKRTVVEAYGAVAALFGDLDPKSLSKYNSEVNDELDYIEGLFGDLSVAKSQGKLDTPADRLAQYNRSIDALYNELNASSQRRRKVYWERGATEQGCSDCLRLDGQEHTLDFYITRNFIPRKPGASMKCGGHKCDCRWVDADGNEVNVSE